MRRSGVDCEMDLTTTACVREFLKVNLFAARFSLALVGRPLVGEDGGDEVFAEGQMRDLICLVLPEV